MALIDALPDSPRISFSHDLPPNDAAVPVERCLRPSSSSPAAEFNFCVFRDESSSADELFSDGKILPVEIKKRPSPPQKPPPAQLRPQAREARGPDLYASPSSSEGEEKQSCKASFWSFKRSTSLNCGSGYARTLCPLPPLLRSNSTGSTSGVNKRSPGPGSHQKLSKFSSPKPPPPSSSSKPPLKKSSHGGVKVNPVLNVPPANLFGLGSIFSGSKKK